MIIALSNSIFFNIMIAILDFYLLLIVKLSLSLFFWYQFFATFLCLSFYKDYISNYRDSESWKNDNYIGSNIEKKSWIKKFDCKTKILHFGVTNNIFVNCTVEQIADLILINIYNKQLHEI